MRNDTNEEFLFDTHEAAREALRAADQDWKDNNEPRDDDEFIPVGQVIEARELDGMLELGIGDQFAVIDTLHGEYMVDKNTKQWVYTT